MKNGLALTSTRTIGVSLPAPRAFGVRGTPLSGRGSRALRGEGRVKPSPSGALPRLGGFLRRGVEGV